MAKVRLGDIATVVTKGTTPTTMGFQFEDGGINFVKIESISEDGTLLKEKFSHISDECNVQMRRSQLQENDILFSIAGAIGRSAIVTKEILPANTNQALAIIRVPKGKIDYNYLLYALSSSAINQQAAQHQQGVAQLNISLKNVSDFLLPIYTEAMQKRIVHNLKKIDKLISLRKQQLAKLDELVKARFVEMFGDFKNNSKNWPIVKFDELAKIDGNMTTDYEKYADYPHIGIDSIEKETGELKGYRTVKEDGVVSGKYIFTPQHIIYSKIRPNLNKVALPDFEGLCSADAYPILPNPKNCNRIFLALTMRSDYFLDYILQFSARTNLPKVNRKEIAGFSMPLPPLSLQNDFATFVERVSQQKQTIQQSLDKLELMKKALMQEYFG